MLSFLGSIYGKIADARNRLYDRGVFDSFDLGAWTISIGNITTGGTGKTPLVAHVAEILAERGEKVGILTRGYGRKDPERRVLVSDGNQLLAEPRDAGDEPYELARKLIGKAIVIADADRVGAAEWARAKFGITAFVLDDGFQHRRAKRDVDIVCVDATSPFGGGRMLPAGRLREPVKNLKRADIIVITRANLVETTDNLKSEISDLNKHARIFEAVNKTVRIVGLKEFHAQIRQERTEESSQKALAFCGIGNPESFFAQLRREDFEVVSTRSFDDHHAYAQNEIVAIERRAAECGTNVLLTTAKDAVKLKDLRFTIPCFVVEMEIGLDDAAAFAAMI